MATSSPSAAADQPLVHEFIRRFGRRPTLEELAKYEAFGERTDEPVLTRVRHLVARLMARG